MITQRLLRSLLVLIVAALWLEVFSASSSGASQAPLSTATSSHSAPPIPLSEIDLEPILNLPDYLPAGFSGAQVQDTLPEMFNELPEAENQIYQQFQRRGRPAGGVAVILYETKSKAEVAYALLRQGFGPSINELGITIKRKTISDVGNQAEAVTIRGTLFGTVLDSIGLAFIRCSAVVHIRLVGTTYLNEILPYLRRLDERLVVQVCSSEDSKVDKIDNGIFCNERSSSPDVAVRILHHITCGRIREAKMDIESSLKAQKKKPKFHAINGFLLCNSGILAHQRSFPFVPPSYDSGEEERRGAKYYDTAGNLFFETQRYPEALFSYLSSQQCFGRNSDHDMVRVRFQKLAHYNVNQLLLDLFSNTSETRIFLALLLRAEAMILKYLLYPPEGPVPTLDERLKYEVAFNYAIAKMKCDQSSRNEAINSLRKAAKIYDFTIVDEMNYNLIL